jgi:uncharacterized phiE125 gp8 family phage protein
MNYFLKTAATDLAVSVADMKTHLRVTHSDHDDLIESYILAGTDKIEGGANICLKAQTWNAYFSWAEVSDVMLLWKHPISSITSVKYYDTDNALQTVDSGDYITFITGRPSSVTFTDGAESTYERADAMDIEFVGQYSSIPDDIILAIKLYVARVYANPEDPVDEKIGYVERVIEKYRSRGKE